MLVYFARPNKTYVFYESIVRLHLKPVLGGIRLQELTHQHVERLISQKLGTEMSPRMVRHIHRTLVTSLQVAVRYGLVP